VAAGAILDERHLIAIEAALRDNEAFVLELKFAEAALHAQEKALQKTAVCRIQSSELQVVHGGASLYDFEVA